MLSTVHRRRDIPRVHHVRRCQSIGKSSSSVNALLNAQSFQRVPICFDEAAETQSVEKPSRVTKFSVYPRRMRYPRSMKKGGYRADPMKLKMGNVGEHQHYLIDMP